VKMSRAPLAFKPALHDASNRDTHLYPSYNNTSVYLTTTYVRRSGRITNGMRWLAPELYIDHQEQLARGDEQKLLTRSCFMASGTRSPNDFTISILFNSSWSSVRFASS